MRRMLLGASSALVMELVVRGHSIKTTVEHPL